MRPVNLEFSDVSFRYDTSPETVFSSVNITFPRGWTGIVGANGAGKTTLAKLAAGMLRPVSGHITPVDGIVKEYCPQETSIPPEDGSEFLISSDSLAGKLRSHLGVGDSWLESWETLSHGERKRLQIGVSLWKEPDILVLDEPTNHLDRTAREMLIGSLCSFGGTGIVISHDRELLDALCCQCVFMRPEEVAIRRGTFSEGEAAQSRDDRARENGYLLAAAEARKAAQSANMLRRRESEKRHSLSKRGVDRRDHDTKTRIDAARLTGKDRNAGKNARMMTERAKSLLDEARSKHFRMRDVDGILFEGERFRRDSVVTIGETEFMIGALRPMRVPDLRVRPDSRIAITGDNGAGKSVLIRRLVANAAVERERMIFIPQELDDAQWARVAEEMRGLDDRSKGLLFTAVHRLGSEPDRIIASDMLSPGEKRKIMLGIGLLRRPGLIIMDEPTNHMDLPSIQCLEAALNLFCGAVVVVSHDRRFIEQVTDEEWMVSVEKGRSIVTIGPIG